MKSKANQNLKSAQLLIDNRQFTTSVHCSYYAVFEYMKYMLANTKDRPITYEEQYKGGNETSHEFILENIKERLNTDYRNIREFCNDVRYLKKERVNADYTTIEFTDEDSLKCKALAEGLITKLKTYLGNI